VRTKHEPLHISFSDEQWKSVQAQPTFNNKHTPEASANIYNNH